MYQPPPPASALDSSRTQSGLNKAKSLIQGVHGSLPSDSAVSFAPGLNDLPPFSQPFITGVFSLTLLFVLVEVSGHMVPLTSKASLNSLGVR